MVRRSTGKSKIIQDRVGWRGGCDEAFGVSLRVSIPLVQILVVVAITLFENAED